MPQKWEYRTMVRTYRALTKHQDLDAAAYGQPHIHGWPNGWDVDIAKLLPEIGNDGWELVAISSRAAPFSVNNQPALSTDEVWVFKRPKE